MQTYKAYKFRLYPTQQQRDYFNRCIGCGRFVYNWALSLRINAYKNNGTTLSIRKDISPQIPKLKEENPFLKDVDAKGLIGELSRLDEAYQKFFNGTNDYPRFKRKSNTGSYTTQLTKNSINQTRGFVNIPKIGSVKCIFHRQIEGTVKENPYITIKRTTTGEFYIFIFSEISVPETPKEMATSENTIGVDLGLKDFAILDDGTKFHKIETDEKLGKRKKYLQRMLEKKVGSKKGQKKSNNYLKLQRKIAKLDEKVARRREQYQYEVASAIVEKDCRYIGMEDLNVQGLSASGRSKQKLSHKEYLKLSKTEKKKYNRKKNKGLNKSILNAGFYLFKTKLKFKALQQGKEVVEVGRFYASSQTCSNCGAKNKNVKNLKIREWVCSECGTHHDRDVNAAKNIRNEAIRIKNNCETTHKNLRRCNPKVKSVETITNEKTETVGVNSMVIEPETQSIDVINQKIDVDTTCANTAEKNLDEKIEYKDAM